MTAADDNIEFMSPYACNDLIGVESMPERKQCKSEQRQNLKQNEKEEHNNNAVIAKFVQIAPKILASPKELEIYLKSCSMDEITSIEYWAIELRKLCWRFWGEKRFPRTREAWDEMVQQRKRKQIEAESQGMPLW